MEANCMIGIKIRMMSQNSEMVTFQIEITKPEARNQIRLCLT